MINNINKLASASSIADTDKVVVDGEQYTVLQLQSFISGRLSPFAGTETIVKANRNTGRGVQVTLNDLKNFITQGTSSITATDVFMILVGNEFKKVTTTVFQEYLFDFEPSDLSGLQVYFDATDNSTISSTGSTLTQLRDKSGNNNHSNPSGSERPTIGTDPQTGKQALVTGTGSTVLPLTTPLANASYTLFLVHSQVNLDSYTQYLLANSSPLDFTVIDSIINASTGAINFQQDQSLGIQSVLCIRVNAGVATYWQFNGRRRIKTSVGVASATQTISRLLNLTGNSSNGFFGGFLYYNSFLSEENTKSVIKYLVDHFEVNSAGYKMIGFGDSYTVGIGASDAAHRWLNLFAANKSKLVVNAGISGSRFQNVGGVDSGSGYARYANDLVEYPASDMVAILYGFNDITQVGASAEQYHIQLEDMIADLISKGYLPNNIYIGTVPRKYNDANSATVQAYGDAVRAVCRKYGCYCAEVYAAQVANGGDSLFSVDLLHPNDPGHDVIADAFIAATIPS